MSELETVLNPISFLIVAAVAAILLKKLAGEWLPALFHRGRIVQIVEEVDKMYAPKLKSIQEDLEKTSAKLDEAFGAIQQYDEELNAIEKVHSERIVKLEAFREEDRALLREFKDVVVKLEDRMDLRINRLEDRLSESHKEVLKALNRISHHSNEED